MISYISFSFVYFIITTDLYIFLYVECSQQITGSKVRHINHINSPTPTTQFNQFKHYLTTILCSNLRSCSVSMILFSLSIIHKYSVFI